MPIDEKEMDEFVSQLMNDAIDEADSKDLTIHEAGCALFWCWLTFETLAAERLMGPAFRQQVMKELSAKSVTDLIRTYRTTPVEWRRADIGEAIQ